jgi:hypothetical protein
VEPFVVDVERRWFAVFPKGLIAKRPKTVFGEIFAVAMAFDIVDWLKAFNVQGLVGNNPPLYALSPALVLFTFFIKFLLESEFFPFVRVLASSYSLLG